MISLCLPTARVILQRLLTALIDMESQICSWTLSGCSKHTLLLNIKANSRKALSDTILPHRGEGRDIKTGNLQALCFPFIPLADRWRSTNWRPAPDTTFWNHRKQVPAQAAACVQHPLPVPGSRPPTNVWCKYYFCLQFPSFWEFCELIILRWDILAG